MKKIIFSTLAIATFAFTSCSDDDNTTPNVTAPATYKFERNGQTTVSYSGQSTLIKMAEELVSALKNTAKTSAELVAMYNHEEGNADFMDTDLNASSKNIKSKTAASSDYFSANTAEANQIKTDLEAYITKQVSEVYPNWAVDAAAGTAGKVTENGGSERFVNAKGLEYNQAFGKSLIGALMADQMLNNYLDTSVLDAGGVNTTANDNDVLAEGKNYTTMEHKWDEAFGYLYGAEADAENPQLGVDSFLNKYLKRVNDDVDFNDTADNIYNAFKLGRAAIVAKNYELRDEQAKIIRAEVSKVIAVRAVHYLKVGSDALATDKASAFHDLSEGFGFVQSLRFTRNANGEPHISKDDINEMLAKLQEGDGFWTITTDTLNNMAETIATAYGFTVDQAAN